MKVCAAAIFAGHVSSEPVVELIAGTNAEDTSGIKSRRLTEGRQPLVKRVITVSDVLHTLMSRPDIAAQIPAAEIFDGQRRIGWRGSDGHIGGDGSRRHDRRRGSG